MSVRNLWLKLTEQKLWLKWWIKSRDRYIKLPCDMIVLVWCKLSYSSGEGPLKHTTTTTTTTIHKLYSYTMLVQYFTHAFYYRNDQQKKLILKELLPKILGENIILPITHIANQQITTIVIVIVIIIIIILYMNQISPRRPTVTLQYSKLSLIAMIKKTKNLLLVLSLDTSYL